MIRSLFLLTLLLGSHCLSAQVTFDPLGWSEETTFPTGRVDDGACFPLEGKFYAGGGLDASFSVRSDWHRYDPRTESWERLPDLPGAGLQYATGVATEHFGFVLGGIKEGGEFTNACYRYSKRTEQWTELSPPPWEERGAATAFVIENDIYLAGGRNDSVRFNDLWRYDTQLDTWISMGSLPYASGRDEMVSFSYGTYGFLMLGRTSAGGVKEVWRYNSIERRWKQMDDYPGNAVAYSHAVSTYAGGVVVGGEDASGNLLSESYFFDPEKEEWTELDVQPFPSMRGFGLAAIGDTLLTYGGLGTDEQRIRQVHRLILNQQRIFEDVPELVVEPNPAGREVRFLWPWASMYTADVNIFDLNGRLVLTTLLDKGSQFHTCDISDLSPGLYIIQATAAGVTQLRKLVVVP